MSNKSPGIDEILQTMSGDVVMSIFAIVYYLISWMILIGSWAEKHYNGMQTGHMNMFFSLILTPKLLERLILKRFNPNENESQLHHECTHNSHFDF